MGQQHRGKNIVFCLARLLSGKATEKMLTMCFESSNFVEGPEENDTGDHSMYVYKSKTLSDLCIDDKT